VEQSLRLGVLGVLGRVLTREMLFTLPVGGKPVREDASVTQWADEPAPRTWSDTEEQALRLWIALARCYVTFARAVACKVAEYDLTAPQFGILEALYHLGPLSLGELAEKLLVTGGNVTYVMDRLEAQGLVARERSGDDRRVVRAHLTTKGRQAIEGVFPRHASFVEGLVEGLDPEEKEALRGLLKKLGKGIAQASSRFGNC
jgi:MarR family transcriptional regulator, 2-MHQ and catechol-resistance regulon repressor